VLETAIREAGFALSSRIEHDLFRAADRRPEHIALEDGDKSWTFAMLLRRSAAAAQTVAQYGIEPGDRVVLCARKAPETIAALYGIWMAGAVAVPASAELRATQLAHIARHSGAKLVIGDAPLLAALRSEEPLPALLVPLEAFGGEASARIRAELPGGRTRAAFLYTSGSTGLPKGIEIAHDNLIAGARIVSTYLSITEDERVLSVLPFHFDYGLNQLLTTVRKGATLVLQRSTHPGAILRALNEQRITGLAGVPPLWVQLAGPGSPFDTTAFPHLRYVTNSGGAFPLELLDRFASTLAQTEIFLMYGLSEAFRSTFLPPSELSQRPSSMGKAMPETEVFVVDEHDQLARPGAHGQLVHRGPTVALGYFNDERATARAFRTDPFDPGATQKVVYSGDVVRRDEEGFLYFVGRHDQQLKSFGNRVSPEEVELALQRSGLVELAVVGGEPDPVAGHAIIAHVIPASCGTTVEALDTYCRKTMPRYLWPARFELHGRFPLTSSGKVDRKGVLA
jgi:acyl-CoA synthetase (AMP-forming)/AMP-acid ligase II